jgi:hypothetical protein
MIYSSPQAGAAGGPPAFNRAISTNGPGAHAWGFSSLRDI